MAKKILLAEDSATMRKVVELTFAAEDVTVTAVETAEAAIEQAQLDRPDIVIADLSMAGKNGYDVSSALKADPALLGVPVLLLHGSSAPLDPAQAQAVKADGDIVKPFETQTLIDKVYQFLEAKAAPAKPSIGPIKPLAPPMGGGSEVTVEPTAPEPTLPAAKPAPAAPAPPRPDAAKPVVPLPAKPAAPAPPPTVAAPPPRPAAPPPKPAAPAAPPRPAVAAPAPAAPPKPAVVPPRPAAVPPKPMAPKPAPPAAGPKPASPAGPPVPSPVVSSLPATDDGMEITIEAEPPPAEESGAFDHVPLHPPEAAKPPLRPDATLLGVGRQPRGPSVEVDLPGPPAAKAPPAPVLTPIEAEPPGPAATTEPPAPVPTPIEAEPPVLTPVEPAPAATPAPASPPAAAPAPAPVAAPAPASPAAISAVDPAVLEAITKLSREIIERVVWEVVPDLAERIIREELDRLVERRKPS